MDWLKPESMEAFERVLAYVPPANDLDGMELRRAGASVMVSLDVRPWPTTMRRQCSEPG